MLELNMEAERARYLAILSNPPSRKPVLVPIVSRDLVTLRLARAAVPKLYKREWRVRYSMPIGPMMPVFRRRWRVCYRDPIGPKKPLFTAPIQYESVTIADIKSAVCAEFGLTRAQLEGRMRCDSFARQIAIWLASVCCDSPHSMGVICRTVAGLDHTTGLYAKAKIAGLIKSGEYTLPQSLQQFLDRG